MGKKSTEPLKLSLCELKEHLHAHHSVYMQLEDALYYLTDVNFQAWRVQDTAKLNDKGHYTDCSDLVPSVDEFMVVDFGDGKCLKDTVDEAVFFASVPANEED